MYLEDRILCALRRLKYRSSEAACNQIASSLFYRSRTRLQGATSMTSKSSLAALALTAALLSLPTGANAGFVGHDRFWGDVDQRMHRLWSFRWLCRDQAVAAKPAKVRRHKHVPAK